MRLSWIPRYSVDLWAESCPLVSKQQPTHHEREPDIDAVASHTSCPPDPVHTQYITLPCSSGMGDLFTCISWNVENTVLDFGHAGFRVC